MADDTTPTESPPEPEPAKSGGAMRLISAAMISVALVTTGYFLGGRGTAAAPPATTAVEEEEHAVGSIVDLDAVNVNLLNGHYLRIAVSLGLSEEAHYGDDGHGGGTEFPSAPASDLVVSTFSGRSVDELSTAEGRVHVRHELEEGLKEYYHGDVVTVFFTEFVMQ